MVVIGMAALLPLGLHSHPKQQRAPKRPPFRLVSPADPQLVAQPL